MNVSWLRALIVSVVLLASCRQMIRQEPQPFLFSRGGTIAVGEPLRLNALSTKCRTQRGTKTTSERADPDDFDSRRPVTRAWESTICDKNTSEVRIVCAKKCVVADPAKQITQREWQLTARGATPFEIRLVSPGPQEVTVGKKTFRFDARVATKLRVRIVNNTGLIFHIQAFDGDALLPNARVLLTSHGVRKRIDYDADGAISEHVFVGDGAPIVVRHRELVLRLSYDPLEMSHVETFEVSASGVTRLP